MATAIENPIGQALANPVVNPGQQRAIMPQPANVRPPPSPNPQMQMLRAPVSNMATMAPQRPQFAPAQTQGYSPQSYSPYSIEGQQLARQQQEQALQGMSPQYGPHRRYVGPPQYGQPQYGQGYSGYPQPQSYSGYPQPQSYGGFQPDQRGMGVPLYPQQYGPQQLPQAYGNPYAQQPPFGQQPQYGQPPRVDPRLQQQSNAGSAMGAVMAGSGLPPTADARRQAALQQQQGRTNAASAMGSVLGGSGLGLAMSDQTKKIVSQDSLADSFLDHMKPYSYRYTDPNNEPRVVPTGGKYLGVMAQDLERVPQIGPQLVLNTPHGKMVDQKTALSATMAGLARLNERVRALEEDSLKKSKKK